MDDRLERSNELKTARGESRRDSDLATWLLLFGQVYLQEISELVAAAWRETLKDYTLVQIDRGCREALRRCTFMPKPADIIQCIRDTAPVIGREHSEEPPLTPEEAKEVLAKARVELAPFLESKPDGIIEITDEMRERHRQKTQEALKRFGGAA